MKITRRQLRRLINEHVFSSVTKPSVGDPAYDAKLEALAMSGNEMNQKMADDLAETLGDEESEWYHIGYSEAMNEYHDAQRLDAAIAEMKRLGKEYAEAAKYPANYRGPEDKHPGEQMWRSIFALKSALRICSEFEPKGKWNYNDLMIKELIKAFAQSAGRDPKEVAKSMDSQNRPRSMSIKDWQSLLPFEQRKYEYLFPRS